MKGWTVPGTMVQGILPLLLAAVACAQVSAQDAAASAATDSGI